MDGSLAITRDEEAGREAAARRLQTQTADDDALGPRHRDGRAVCSLTGNPSTWGVAATRVTRSRSMTTSS